MDGQDLCRIGLRHGSPFAILPMELRILFLRNQPIPSLNFIIDSLRTFLIFSLKIELRIGWLLCDIEKGIIIADDNLLSLLHISRAIIHPVHALPTLNQIP